MERHTFAGSKSVVWAGYDRTESVLAIQFVEGGLYHYFMVPETVYQEFVTADSAGAFFHARIRGHYPYERMG